MPDVPIVLLEQGASPPRYAHLSDAGSDLEAASDVVLAPGGGRARVGTGLALELPEGFCGLILPRSGLAAKHGVTCLNAPGLIDAGYRGEIQVVLVNLDPADRYEVRRGDRIAQLLIVEAVQARFIVAGKLSTSDRGSGGFGGSGR